MGRSKLKVRKPEKISKKTLKMMDKSMKNLAQGKVGEPIPRSILEELGKVSHE